MDVSQLERLLESGRDSATLRFALGSAYLKEDDTRAAIEHLAVAVALDVDYSAAWKLLGQAQTEAELFDEAEQSFARGIEAATRRGDVQAAREMQVFKRRLTRRRKAPQS